MGSPSEFRTGVDGGMRPLVAAGSWPLVDGEEGEWFRLSILPKEAGKESATRIQWQLKQWKAYLLAGLGAFAGVQPCSFEDSCSVKCRQITQAIPTDLDSFRLLHLYHNTSVMTSKGGLITFSSVLHKLPWKLGANTSVLRNITSATSRSSSRPQLTYNSIFPPFDSIDERHRLLVEWFKHYQVLIGRVFRHSE